MDDITMNIGIILDKWKYPKDKNNISYIDIYKEKNNFYKENRTIYTTITKKNKLMDHNWLIWYLKKTNNIKRYHYNKDNNH